MKNQLPGRVKTAPVFAFESGSRRPFRYRDELSARIEFQNGCDRPRHRHTSLIEFREVMRYARVGICHLFIFKHSNFRDLISSALLISRDRRFDLQAFLLIDPIGIKLILQDHIVLPDKRTKHKHGHSSQRRKPSRRASQDRHAEKH